MKRKTKYNTPIRITCAALFGIFSFLYISLLQGEQLAFVQDYLAQGKTSNSTFVTALLITLLLMLVQFLLNRLGKLHGRYEALSYLPSCVLLSLITKVDSTLSYSLVQWIVAVVVVVALYVLVVWLNRNTLQSRDEKFLRRLIPNLGVMAALFIFTGWYGNSSSAEYMELAAWKHAHSKEFDKVLEVAQNSDDYNADLTALRNLALAKTGQLGSKLFAYPQPYGSDGLMMNRYKVQTPSYGAQEYYSLLGTQPYGGERAAAFYKRVMQQTGDTEYANLYAAALLLDKDLGDFVAYTAGNGNKTGSLASAPVHYQEAWMVYNEQHPFSPVDFVPDSTVAQRYREYLALREEYADTPIVMHNLCKRRFGDTYWYYYDFVN
jgi:hypothetical protein